MVSENFIVFLLCVAWSLYYVDGVQCCLDGRTISCTLLTFSTFYPTTKELILATDFTFQSMTIFANLNPNLNLPYSQAQKTAKQLTVQEMQIPFFLTARYRSYCCLFLPIYK